MRESARLDPRATIPGAAELPSLWDTETTAISVIRILPFVAVLYVSNVAVCGAAVILYVLEGLIWAPLLFLPVLWLLGLAALFTMFYVGSTYSLAPSRAIAWTLGFAFICAILALGASAGLRRMYGGTLPLYMLVVLAVWVGCFLQGRAIQLFRPPADTWRAPSFFDMPGGVERRYTLGVDIRWANKYVAGFVQVTLVVLVVTIIISELMHRFSGESGLHAEPAAQWFFVVTGGMAAVSGIGYVLLTAQLASIQALVEEGFRVRGRSLAMFLQSFCMVVGGALVAWVLIPSEWITLSVPAIGDVGERFTALMTWLTEAIWSGIWGQTDTSGSIPGVDGGFSGVVNLLGALGGLFVELAGRARGVSAGNVASWVAAIVLLPWVAYAFYRTARFFLGEGRKTVPEFGALFVSILRAPLVLIRALIDAVRAAFSRIQAKGLPMEGWRRLRTGLERAGGTANRLRRLREPEATDPSLRVRQMMKRLETKSARHGMPRARSRTAVEYELDLKNRLFGAISEKAQRLRGLDLAQAYVIARYGHGVSENAAEMASEDFERIAEALQGVKGRKAPQLRNGRHHQ